MHSTRVLPLITLWTSRTPFYKVGIQLILIKMKKSVFLLLSVLTLFSCTHLMAQKKAKPMKMENRTVTLYSSDCITEAEVVAAQLEWGEGIVKIGKVFSEGGNYTEAAANHIQTLYGYDLSSVLFKPTLASEEQFRGTFDGALSYFVGGNSTYNEDKGFAIAPYTNVRWENEGIINNSCNMAIAMGNYYFTTTSGKEIKVEYTFAYVKDTEGKLRIVVHKSALPYTPAG